LENQKKQEIISLFYQRMAEGLILLEFRILCSEKELDIQNKS